MALDIRFIKNPSIGLSGGVHLLVDDGCEIMLDESQDLTEEQSYVFDKTRGENRRRHLFYLNKTLTDLLIKNNGCIKLHCPTCKKNYLINKEEYDTAYKAFQKGSGIPSD